MSEIIEEFPTELLLKIFNYLTVTEKLKARTMSRRWNSIITDDISPHLQITINERALKYRKQSLEKVIESYCEGYLSVDSLKLSGMDIGINTAYCFTSIGPKIQDLTLSDIRIDGNELYSCLSKLSNLQKLSLLNCNIKVSNSEVFIMDLLPKLSEIEVDILKIPRENLVLHCLSILENFLQFNDAKLNLKMRVMFHNDYEEINFIKQFGQRLKNLELEILQPSVLSKLFENNRMDLDELIIVGSLSIPYPWYIREIVLSQQNLRKLCIYPKMQMFTTTEIGEIQQNLRKLEYFAFSTGDQFVDNDIRQPIYFKDNLYHLDIKYHGTALRYVNADQLKELAIHPYRINQDIIGMIERKFIFLKKLSLDINGESGNTILDVTNCFNLQYLEELEIIDQLQVIEREPWKKPPKKSKIVLFKPKNNQLPENFILKKIKIKNVNVNQKEFKRIFKMCPFIEELELVECGFSYDDTKELIEIVCSSLKKLKKICYTCEYYQNKKTSVPRSAKKLLQDCPGLQSIEFSPKLSPLDGSFDIAYQEFYNSLSSFSTIKHFYDSHSLD